MANSNNCACTDKENVCSLKVSEKDINSVIDTLYNKGSVCEEFCEDMAKSIWIELNKRVNPDCQIIKTNDCDLIALTEYEGGEPILYTISDKELNQWIKADNQHSWFPVNLEM